MVTCSHNDSNMIKSINTQKHQALTKWLKEKRLEKELSIRQLGNLLEEPFLFVSKIERGQRNLTVHEYVQYCHALGIDNTEGLKFFE